MNLIKIIANTTNYSSLNLKSKALDAFEAN